MIRRLKSPRLGENTGLEVQVTSEPATPVLTAAEAKDWARISTSAEDTIITELVEAATKQLESHYNLAFIDQTRKAYWLTFAQEVPLPNGPHQSITSVKRYYQGTATTLTSSDYHTSGNQFWHLYPSAVYSSRQGGRNAYSLEVVYVCGYGSASSDVPEAIRRAVAIRVADLYEYRQEMRLDKPSNMSMSAQVERLMQPYSRREWI